MNEKSTYVRYTRETLPPSKTDWERFDALTDEEVMAAALADPDAQPLTEEQLKRGRLVGPLNPRPSVSIDHKTFAWFRDHEGDDPQARINEVLHEYVSKQEKRDAA